MIELKGPLPTPTMILILPNPQLSDQYIPTSQVTTKRAINGTKYTYVKRSPRKRLLWSFRLDRSKALELNEFYRQTASSSIRVKDHLEREWIGYLTINPLEGSADNRAAGPTMQEGLRAEKFTYNIEFEGIQQ